MTLAGSDLFRVPDGEPVGEPHAEKSVRPERSVARMVQDNGSSARSAEI
jgi:hypothetical protein